MWRFATRRLLLALPVLFVVSILDFGFISLAPGDPLQAMLPQGDANSIASMEEERDAAGLNDSIPVRYVRWMGQLAQGNLGESFRTGKPTTEAIADALPNTLRLTLTATLIALLLGVPLGIVSALKERSTIDEVLTFFSFFIASIPSFFLALVGVFVFAVRLHWFPATGANSFDKPGDFVDSLHHLLLPAMVLGILQCPGYIRHLRAAVLETMKEDYVQTARSKGLHERTVVVHHVLRNALMPVITLLGLQIPGLVGSSVLIEQVFAWPGLGTLSINSALFRDYSVFMGTALLYAAAVVLSSTLTDLAYAVVNPRVRHG